MNDQTQNPFTAQQITQLEQLLANATTTQLEWLADNIQQKLHTLHHASLNLSATTTALPLAITVLSATQTGNARHLAEQLQQDLTRAGLNVKHIALGDYNAEQLVNEQYLLLITATQGEGEVPEEAFNFYDMLFSEQAPSLAQLKFAVFGLGDSS